MDAGADDYLTKPFSTGELLARIRVAMRHANQTTGEPIITIGDLVVDVAHRLVTEARREISLTPTEYMLLKTLALSVGKVLMHRHLLREVWGPAYDHDTNLLRVTISKLRHKMEVEPPVCSHRTGGGVPIAHGVVRREGESPALHLSLKRLADGLLRAERRKYVSECRIRWWDVSRRWRRVNSALATREMLGEVLWQ